MQPTLVATPRELLSHTVMVRLDEDLLRCLDLLAIEMGGASRAQVMRSALLALARQHRAELLRLGKRYGAAKPGADELLKAVQALFGAGGEHEQQ